MPLLIANAIKFTDTGGITLNIRKTSNQKLYFEVIDTGIGIDLEKQTNLFEAFTQVESNYTREYRGTGLGLNICKKLVELMEGEIGVHSILGIGSTFYFTIPFKAAKQVSSSTNLKTDTTLPNGNNMYILVVEDYIVNQKLVCTYLEKLGYPFEVAENGLQAVDMAQKMHFDLILMDIQMPKMDGINATIEIRKFNSSVPIIAMTAHALEKEKDHCMSIGMNDYLTKPFTKNQLNVIISQYQQKLTKTVLQESVKEKKLFEHLLDDMGGDQYFVNDLLTIFKIELIKSMKEFKIALANRDLDSLSDINHKLQPSLELFRLYEQKTLIANLYAMAKEGLSMDETNASFLELENTIPSIIKQIDSILRQTKT